MDTTENQPPLTGYEACKIWCAAKAHYLSDSYDVSKYNWSFKLDEETYRQRRDRFTFERLAREYESELCFKRAVGWYLYDNPKGSLRGLIRPNVGVNAALERHHYIHKTFRHDYRTGYTPETIFRDVAEGKIAPEYAAVWMDFFYGSKFQVTNTWQRFRKCALLPKYNAFIGYNRGEVAKLITGSL